MGGEIKHLVTVLSMISIETIQSSLNCEVVLIWMLEVYRVIQYFEVVPYRGDLVFHLLIQ